VLEEGFDRALQVLGGKELAGLGADPPRPPPGYRPPRKRRKDQLRHRMRLGRAGRELRAANKARANSGRSLHPSKTPVDHNPQPSSCSAPKSSPGHHELACAAYCRPARRAAAVPPIEGVKPPRPSRPGRTWPSARRGSGRSPVPAQRPAGQSQGVARQRQNGEVAALPPAQTAPISFIPERTRPLRRQPVELGNVDATGDRAALGTNQQAPAAGRPRRRRSRPAGPSNIARSKRFSGGLSSVIHRQSGVVAPPTRIGPIAALIAPGSMARDGPSKRFVPSSCSGSPGGDRDQGRPRRPMPCLAASAAPVLAAGLRTFASRARMSTAVTPKSRLQPGARSRSVARPASTGNVGPVGGDRAAPCDRCWSAPPSARQTRAV